VERPNHILLNEYVGGQGISLHKDGPLYQGMWDSWPAVHTHRSLRLSSVKYRRRLCYHLYQIVLQWFRWAPMLRSSSGRRTMRKVRVVVGTQPRVSLGGSQPSVAEGGVMHLCAGPPSVEVALKHRSLFVFEGTCCKHAWVRMELSPSPPSPPLSHCLR
jgi:hypothetical protein